MFHSVPNGWTDFDKICYNIKEMYDESGTQNTFYSCNKRLMPREDASIKLYFDFKKTKKPFSSFSDKWPSSAGRQKLVYVNST